MLLSWQTLPEVSLSYSGEGLQLANHPATCHLKSQLPQTPAIMLRRRALPQNQTSTEMSIVKLSFAMSVITVQCSGGWWSDIRESTLVKGPLCVLYAMKDLQRNQNWNYTWQCILECHIFSVISVALPSVLASACSATWSTTELKNCDNSVAMQNEHICILCWFFFTDTV